jgi:PKHD-type hydroxylase
LAPGWVTQAQMAHKIRKLSVTVNLTTPGNYVGGNLKFDLGPHAPKRYHVCKEIRPRGTIIVFPSHLYHQVTPVTKGTRYSLVMWNLGHPFR